MAAQLPTGTVTFLFTDIESSASLAQAHPQAMPALLAQHHNLLRQAVEAQGGVVFRIIGDAFCAAFETGPAAVAAALEAQRALQHAAWDPAPVRVRMGLHTGAAQASKPDSQGDYTGYLTLTRAQRVMAVAHGEQVLLSDATAKLVNDTLPDDASLRDLGEHRLKGLLQSEQLWQLAAPGLREDFPPLPSLKAVPHNLPAALTSFIGREPELAEVKRLLAGTRLLTLTGPGGTGKTRLSLQAAAEMLESFPEGVWLVELAALSDPALVPQSLAAVWALREQPGRPLIDTLQDYARPKGLLLILDNCEHLLEACAQLATALLRACPKLKVLTSSREALGVAGETAYRVPSLTLPDPQQPLSAEPGAQPEAVRLFVDRAQSAQPRFSATAANLIVIAQICRRLDGIPLALELAAARVNVLSVEQIGARLDDRFRLLTGGSRSALPRQQTLRALIDWSYDLLPPPEREALGRLSVFAGGWTLEAAEALLGLDALDLLTHLIDKSLVVVDQQAGSARYRLLETIRQYARDKLLESGNVSAVRDQHLQHYLRCAEEVEPRYQGPEMLAALDQMQADLDNLRSALEWALERNPASALRLASALTIFWQRRGHLPEGRRWLRDCLARYQAGPPASPSAVDQRLRARAFWAAGTLAWGHGAHVEARAFLEQSAALARELGDQQLLVDALGILGFTAIWESDGETAKAVMDEALSVLQTIDYRWGQGLIKGVQGEYARRILHDYDQAEVSAAANVQFLRSMGNPWIGAIVIMGLGAGASLQGRQDEALRHVAEAEKLFREMGDRQMTTAARSERAHILRRLGWYAEALAVYAQTLIGWQELGHLAAVAHQLESVGFMAIAQSQFERAARLLGAAEPVREIANSPMEGFEQREHERNVATLRAQLPAADFEALLAAGRALSVEEAIALALEPVRTG